ncbi:glycosyl transferase group 1 [Candidatus Scalindua japonica]|uniref:Glycosyl transferase group 1 n=1 Tax=Candidatus Scalindua japonica TaxID=1284222 RepID=A0A286U4C8_9BACT|nr:glycosyltransferase [Candidatus Scalindua japonica]GAX62992.1 glycosyl transferase group 1 [Candidatus Scalindua japonica]
MANLTRYPDKIRVLYLVLEMELGGLQRIVKLLIDKLDREKFIPYLCCLDNGGFFYDQLENNLLKAYILQRKPGPFDIGLLVRLYKILRENKIDIIHSQSGCMVYAALAGRLARVKRIVHTDHGRFKPDKRSIMLEEWISSKVIHHVIGVSHELTEYLALQVKIKRKKLLTIINGVDTHKFIPMHSERRNKLKKKYGLNEEVKVLGTICRLDPVKNLEFLISCLPSICEKVTECRLLIVGDGPCRERLIKHAESLGIDSKISFTGAMSDVDNVLPAFDVYVCTSLSEGTSMTILEAMSCGLPVVASAVGGNSSLVDESNGRLFPLNDADVFKRSVIELLEDEELRKQTGQEGRNKIEKNYDFDNVVRQYEKLYSSF